MVEFYVPIEYMARKKKTDQNDNNNNKRWI